MADLDTAVAVLAAAPRLLVALDFDGTIAPLADDPMAARPLPESAAAIERLRALPGTWMAYVSGRPLDALRLLSGAAGDALLVGSHGAEVQLGDGRSEAAATVSERGRLDALLEALERLAPTVPGVWVERKPLGYALHSRLSDPALVPALHEAARRAAEEVGGFQERTGHDILEFSARHVSKGYGVEALRRAVAERAGDEAVVLYIGDDLTDEDAFAVLRPGDVGVKVGEGPSRAPLRLADPPAVAGFLTRLADARAVVLTRTPRVE